MNNIFYRGQAMFESLVSPLVLKVPATTMLDKNQYVETLRGLAIILVVLGHIIGSTSTGGLKVGEDSFFRYLYFSVEYIRMPLFTVISGWVYANKPVLPGDRKNFITGKLRRLILPMIVISTLLYLLRIVVPGTNSTPELSRIGYNFLYPYDVYWFLYSLFVIFLAISLLDRFPAFHKFQGWLGILISAFALQLIAKNFFGSVPNIFSIKGAIYLFPFFITGIGIYRFQHLFSHRKMSWVLLLVLFCGIIVQQLSWFGYIPLQSKQSMLAIAIGVSSVMLLFRMKFRNGLLSWIGSYAYSIFLFHVFFTGGTRIVLLKSGIQNQWVILIFALVLAILIPVILENLIDRSRGLRLLLLGKKSPGA